MNCWEKDLKAIKPPNMNTSACCQEAHVALGQDAVWREDGTLEVLEGGTVNNEAVWEGKLSRCLCSIIYWSARPF